uniref:Uncharacterized protein n=1 Tax=Oryza brachyantha TaxID=4533 RepID=J3MLN3_ORYBR
MSSRYVTKEFHTVGMNDTYLAKPQEKLVQIYQLLPNCKDFINPPHYCIDGG